MEQTDYLFEFLDPATRTVGFPGPPESPGTGGAFAEEFLWKAGRPSGIEERNGDVIVRIPFQRLLSSGQVPPEAAVRQTEATEVEYRLVLRAYGDQILRIFIDFGAAAAALPPADAGSPLLDLDNELAIVPLTVEKNERQWTIRDDKGRHRAVFVRTMPETEHWSDLLPPPGEALRAAFYPDGEKEVAISTWDQFFPGRSNALPLGFAARNGIPDRATVSFEAQAGENFAGTGERFAKMDLAGRTLELRNQDGQGVNSRRTYKNVPFYLSSEGYGLFLHTTSCSRFSLADYSSRSVQILAGEPVLDLFLIGGANPERVLFEYRRLTGFPPLPPLWSFGIWMSRMSYFSAAEVRDVCDRLRKEAFPCDVIHLDTGWFRTDWLCEWKFHPGRFPDPPGFIADLKKQGFRLSLWQMPYIARQAAQYEEAKDRNYIGGPLPGSSRQDTPASDFSLKDYAGSIDFTYPEAVRWYQRLLEELLDMGVACIKADFGEAIHTEAVYHSMEPALLGNLYALLYQKAAFEITKERTGEGIIWARAGWAGCQRYPIHWGGDAAATWDGMAGSLRGGLHLGLSGFGFWSHDVPGFHGLPDFMNAVIPEELYLRWTQFGVFTSHIRYHGTSRREPWHYPGIAAAVRAWWNLRYALIPYLLEQSRKTTETGYPVLRALILHHPGDKTCWHIDDQYYFGDDFLVAPVMNPGGRREVYLPQGEWTGFFTGKQEQGGRWITVEAGPEEMPVWVRAGAEVSFYPEKVSCTDEMDLTKTRTIRFDNSFKGIWNETELNHQKI